MIVACSLDRRFCEPTGVMLASLFANGEVGDMRVVVFGLGLRPRDKRKLRASCGPDGERLEFIDVESSEPTLVWLTSFWPKPSLAVYVRLLMPGILANQDERLLFMDCDMLVVSSLRPLAAFDMDGSVIAAVNDSEETHPVNDARPDRIAFPAEEPYFNAGLMLIDLAKWQAGDFTRRVFDVIDEKRDRLKWYDQDALNVALQGNWKALDPEWNVFPAAAEKLGGYDKARIIHYTGGGKPWSRECTHPRQNLYLRYRDRTPWRGRRLETRFERRWRKILKKRRKSLESLWGGASAKLEPTAPQRPPAT